MRAKGWTRCFDLAILVGTASWTDPTLLACGRFYPPGVRSAEARLRHYAARFPLVEADSPFYALPDPATAQAWAERTPPGFVFDVKAFRLFAGHGAAPATLPAELRRELPDPAAAKVFYFDLPGDLQREFWQRYLGALEPLRQAGRLGAIQLQFPPWIRNDRTGRAWVAHCAERVDGCTAAVEFRHQSWLHGPPGEATLDFLAGLGLAHTVVDSPQGHANTVPAVWRHTRGDLAVVRLHGRNGAAWNGAGRGASSSRFTYEYPPEELAGLARRIRELARHVRETHVVLNTNYEDQGMLNAQRLRQALQTLDGGP